MIAIKKQETANDKLIFLEKTIFQENQSRLIENLGCLNF